MYLMAFPYALLHIIKTLSEDVTLRIDLSYVEIISARLLRVRETFGMKMHGLPLICWFRRFYHVFYMTSINLNNSQIMYKLFIRFSFFIKKVKVTCSPYLLYMKLLK